MYQLSIYKNNDYKMFKFKEEINILMEQIDELEQTKELINELEKMSLIIEKKKRIAELKKARTYKQERGILISKYIHHLMELDMLNKELYNNTELFEGKDSLDFNHELWNIFKNKIGYYSKLIGKIYTAQERNE